MNRIMFQAKFQKLTEGTLERGKGRVKGHLSETPEN